VVAAATLIRRRGPLVLVERQCNQNVETAAELASSRRIRMATGGSRANRLWPLCYSPVVAAEPPDGLILDTSGTCQSSRPSSSPLKGVVSATPPVFARLETGRSAPLIASTERSVAVELSAA
jgi:hypothetical protein